MMINLEGFTEAEKQQILNQLEEVKQSTLTNRRTAETKAIRAKNNVAILKIAADYLDWLQINDRASTYSAFCNEFDFDSRYCTRPAFGLIQGFLGVIRHFDGFPEDVLFADVDYQKPPYKPLEEDD